jgi:hypothetical protein
MAKTKGINYWLDQWSTASSQPVKEKKEVYKEAIEKYKVTQKKANWKMGIMNNDFVKKELMYKAIYSNPIQKVYWSDSASAIPHPGSIPPLPKKSPFGDPIFQLDPGIAPSLLSFGKVDPSLRYKGMIKGSIDVYYQCPACEYNLVFTHPHRCKDGGKFTVRWSDIIPSTQKALGIATLAIGAAREEIHYAATGGPFHKALLMSDEDSIQRLRKEAKSYKKLKSITATSPLDYLPSAKANGLFARPCPATPRHGFVDSRVIEPTWKAVIELMREVKDADPKGELILQEYIDATHSVVFVPRSGSLSIGSKNDGATAGKGVIVIPTIPRPPRIMGVARPKEFASRTKIKLTKGEHEHFEGVFCRKESSDGYTLPVESRWVQARGAPPVPSGAVPDFIPKEMEIKDVYNAVDLIDDLLWWEKECQKLKHHKGLVVYAPNVSLASHMAIHCILNDIPLVTSREPKIGDTLVPPATKPFKVNWDEFEEGVQALIACKGKRPDIKGKHSWSSVGKIVGFCIGAMHNVPALQYSEHYSRLMGFASYGILLAGAVSACGEARHYDRFKKAYNSDSDLDNGPPAPPRHVTWGKVWDSRSDIGKLITKLEVAEKRFGDYKVWGGKDSASAASDFGYGGPRWEKVAKHSLVLANTIKARKSLPAIIKAMNVLVNTVHNGGPCLNKLVDRNALDSGATNPGSLMASHGIVFRDVFNLEGSDGTTG